MKAINDQGQVVGEGQVRDRPPPGRCPDCWCEVDTAASICCPKCLQRRREQLAALQAQEVGGQSCTDEMADKMQSSGAVGGGSGSNEEKRRMHSSGYARNGRVMRKGEIYGG